MKSSLIPGLCGFSLACMLGLVGFHWWAVKAQVAQFHAAIPDSPTAIAATQIAKPELQQAAPKHAAMISDSIATTDASGESFKPAKGEREFYELLIQKLKNLEHQNSELRDQIAETNRAQYELEFRVDHTLSTSFVPLRAVEDRGAPLNANDFPDGMEIDSGVLPALPVDDLPR
jgi:hypothetical protein